MCSTCVCCWELLTHNLCDPPANRFVNTTQGLSLSVSLSSVSVSSLLPATAVPSPPTHTQIGYQPEAGRGALYPNEVASDFAFIPFGGGARKCVGDQFALFEATVAFAMLLRRFSFRLAVPVEQVGMATGATIHTANGMMMRVTPRQQQKEQKEQQSSQQPAAAAV